MGSRLPARLVVVLAWLWTLVLHISLWVLEFRGRALWGDEQRYLDSARALLQGSPSWWPEPFWPPLQSHVLGGLLATGGHRLLLIGLFQTFLLLVTALALGDLIGRWSGSARAGNVAVWLCLSYPPLVAFTHYLWPEVLHLSLFVMAIWMLCCRPESRAWNILTGLALGLALLTKSLLGPFLPLLLIGALIYRDRAWRRAAWILGMLLLTLSPVLWAQAHRLGRPLIADSSAFNLWVGLNDRGLKNFEDEYVARAYEEFRRADGDFFQRNALLRKRSFEKIRREGILPVLKAQFCRQYFRLFDRENYLGEQLLDGAAVRLGLGYRDREMLLARMLRSVSYLFYGLLLVLAPVSLVFWSWSEMRWPRILLLFLAYNLAIFLWFHVKSRYRIQLLPVFFLAAPMISGLVFGFENHLRQFTRTRGFIAVAVAGLGLFLAFGGSFLR